jgi:hypothetical protein
MTTLVRVQRLLMPSGVESATVVRDGDVVDCADRFLAHLTAIERSPNTVRAYATTCATSSPFSSHDVSRGMPSSWRTSASSSLACD